MGSCDLYCSGATRRDVPGSTAGVDSEDGCAVHIVEMIAAGAVAAVVGIVS